MKAKKIIALMIGVVSLVGLSVPVKAATYAPVDSSKYYTQTYTLNRNGVSYKGNARRRTGFVSSSGYTLDGNISIAKPVGGSFSYCTVDSVFVTGMPSYSRYNLSVFNTPASGVKTTIDSNILVTRQSDGRQLYAKTNKSNSYKYSNSVYVDTTEKLNIYGYYSTRYNGMTFVVSTYSLQY